MIRSMKPTPAFSSSWGKSLFFLFFFSVWFCIWHAVSRILKCNWSCSSEPMSSPLRTVAGCGCRLGQLSISLSFTADEEGRGGCGCKRWMLWVVQMPTTNSTLDASFYTFLRRQWNCNSVTKLWLSAAKNISRQISARQTTSIFLLLPPAVPKSCPVDVVTLTPRHAPSLTPPQLLRAFLFKAVFFSSCASWHKCLSDLLATCTGRVPGKRKVTQFTWRKRERSVCGGGGGLWWQLESEEGLQAWKEDWQKKTDWKLTSVLPTHCLSGLTPQHLAA